MRRLISISVCLGAIAGLHGVSGAELRLTEPWRCFFGGQPIVLHLEAVADRLTEVRISWHFSVARAVAAAGERVVLSGPEHPAVAPVKIACPMPRPGTVAPGRLAATLIRLSDGRRLTGIEVGLRFFPKDPFADRRQWAASLNLRLFDPVGDTARQFQAQGIPFARIGDPRTLKWGDAHVFLLTGAGNSFSDHPGLLEWLVRKAMTGADVLCVAPSRGSFPVPDQAVSRPEQFLLRGTSCITLLDPKLDATAWPPDGPMIFSSVTCSTDGTQSPRLVIAPNKRGWPWLLLEFPSGGRFVVCGFDLVGKWEDGPVPRYLLARILEWMTSERQRQSKETRYVLAPTEDR